MSEGKNHERLEDDSQEGFQSSSESAVQRHPWGYIWISDFALNQGVLTDVC